MNYYNMTKLNGISRTSRIVLLTDLHLRSDYFPGFLEKQIETIVGLVNKKPPEYLVFLGDIFDKRNPRGEELLAFDTILSKIKCPNIYILRGNHDTIRKDGTSSTTLSLYKDKARIISDSETCFLGGMNFDFIPHYEDEEMIIKDLSASKNPVFGHFGFDGCVSNGHYAYESFVKRSHFKKKLAFLGHIHKPKQYSNVYVLGTPYSNTFGEANTQKYVHEIIIRNQKITEVVKKPIDFGIRHIVCTLDELESSNAKYAFERFFTILRLKLDSLDSYAEIELRDKIASKYNLAHIEISFEDILPKYSSWYNPKKQVFTIDDDIIDQYISSRNSVFSKQELYAALEEIKSYEN